MTNRFVDVDASFRRLTPVYGYLSAPLVSIDEALAGLHTHVGQLSRHVETAKRNCTHPCEHGLTRDESASIYIYTMEWAGQTLYRVLNQALRNEDRKALTIWFPYLKLFMSGLQKLPKVKDTVLRGVSKGMGGDFTRDQVFTWWGMSSCSTSPNVIDEFLGNNGRSTMFVIQAVNGRAISQYSEPKNEEEVILPMGAQFRVKGDSLIRENGQDCVYLVQIDEPQYHKWKPHATTVAGGNRFGRKLNQLSGPHGIFVDQNKCILVADHFNQRVVQWGSGAKEGTVVAGRNREGRQIDQLNGPRDVIMDSRDRSIIVADAGNRRVVRWFEGTTRQPQILVENIDCVGLAMGKEGSLYVSDSRKHEVRRWREGDPQSTIIAGGKERGDRLDQLNGPTYLFVDDEHSVYVSDSGNHRVMKFRQGASEGTVAAGGNARGDKLNQLSSPQGVLVDPWGQIYVADEMNHRVIRWREGEREGELIVGGVGDGQELNQLNRPNNLSLDDEGNLYVADLWNHRVQKFDLDAT